MGIVPNMALFGFSRVLTSEKLQLYNKPEKTILPSVWEIVNEKREVFTSRQFAENVNHKTFSPRMNSQRTPTEYSAI